MGMEGQMGMGLPVQMSNMQAGGMMGGGVGNPGQVYPAEQYSPQAPIMQP